jgi:hypothetical protein
MLLANHEGLYLNINMLYFCNKPWSSERWYVKKQWCEIMIRSQNKLWKVKPRYTRMYWESIFYYNVSYFTVAPMFANLTSRTREHNTCFCCYNIFIYVIIPYPNKCTNSHLLTRASFQIKHSLKVCVNILIQIREAELCMGNIQVKFGSI